MAAAPPWASRTPPPKPAKLGGGGRRGISTPPWIAREVAAQKKAAEGKDLLGQVGDIVSSVPSGIAHMAESAAKEYLINPGKMIVEGAVEGDPLKALEGVGRYGLSAAGFAAGGGLGFLAASSIAPAAHELLGDRNTAEEFPLSSEVAQSFERTGERLIHPSRYLKAVDQGQIVGTLLEDVANLTLVAGGAAKAIKVGAPSVEGALSARSAADALGERLAAARKGLAKATDDVAASESTLRAAEGPLNDAALGGSGLPQWQRLKGWHQDRVNAVADWQGELDNVTQLHAQATAAADQALAKAGQTYQAYRLLKGFERLGAKGAFAPAAPYALVIKALPEGARALFTKFPVLKSALERANDVLGVTEAVERIGRSRFAGKIMQDTLGQGRNITTRETAAVSQIEQLLGGDPIALQAMQMDLAGFGEALNHVTEALRGSPEGIEFMEQHLAQIAEATGNSAAAYRMAMGIADGSIDAALLERIRAAQDLWRRDVGGPHQFDWLEQQLGARRAEDPEATAARAEFQTGDQPHPMALQRVEDRFATEEARLLEQRTEQRRQAAKERQGLLAPPGVRIDLGPEMQRRVEIASRLVEDAATNPHLRAEILRITRLERGATEEALIDALTSRLESLTNPSGRRRYPELASATADDGLRSLGLKVPGRTLAEVQRVSRAEGVAETARALADRIAEIRQSVPTKVSDTTVEALANAVEDYRTAQGRLTETAARVRDAQAASAEAAVADRAAAQAAKSPEVIEFEAQIKDVRAKAIELAKREQEALAQIVGDEKVPFIPGDISELHQGLHERLGAGDSTIRAEMDRVRAGLKGRAQYTTTEAQVFAKAYKRLWNRLPASAKYALEKLDNRAIESLYRRWADGTVTMYEGGLDGRALEVAEYDASMGEAAGVTDQANVEAFLDRYARLADLRRAINNAHFHRWSPAVADAFARAGDVTNLTGLFDEPLTRLALEGGTTEELAAAYAARLADAEAVPIPDAQALRNAADEYPFPLDDEDALLAVRDAFGGDPNGPEFAAFYDRWEAAGQPRLNDAVNQLVNGETPEWLAPPEAPAIPGAAVPEMPLGDFVTENGSAILTRTGDGEVYVRNLSVPPGQRGQGRGTALVREITDQADATGTALQLHVAPGNTAAIRAYEGAGFRPIEDTSALAGPDAILMRREPAAAPTPLLDRAQASEAAAREAAAGAQAAEGAARGEIGRILATEGGQALSEPLAGVQQQAARTAQGAERTAALGPEVTRKLLTDIAGPAFEAGRREGIPLAQHLKTLRALGYTERSIAKLPERLQEALDRAAADLKNAPARYRPAINVARQFTRSVNEWAEFADQIDPMLADAIHRMNLNAIEQLKDVTVPGQVAKGATLEPLPPLFDPEYVPTVGKGAGRPKAPEAGGPQDRFAARLATEEHAKAGATFPKDFDQLRRTLRNRVWEHTTNEAVREVAQQFGTTARQVLGELDDEGNMVLDMSGADILDAMHDEGLVSWNPEQVVRGGRILDPAQVTPDTLFVPIDVFDKTHAWFRQGGGLERWMRRYYDKPMNVWRAAVLALRPAWHVNNILSQALISTTMGGIDPATYVKRMGQARALLEQDAAALEARFPDLIPDKRGPFGEARTARARARAPRRLERIERRIAGIEPETRAALEGTPEIAGGLGQRGPGAEVARTELGGETTLAEGAALGADRAQPRTLLGRGIQRSYAWNGFWDDSNRLAMFLEKRKTLSDAEVHQLAARDPALVGLSGDTLRTHASMRISLRMLGDFMRMSPIERTVIRRIIPFWAWARHITQLALKMPVYAPTRVVWFLHLADLFGEPPESAIVTGALPLGGDQFLQLSQFNPYQDVLSTNPRDLAFNLSPAIRIAAGAITGTNLQTGQQFKRPPGTGPLDEFGNPKAAPLLTRPGELLQLIGSSFPQIKLLQAANDTRKYGEPILRYPLGQPMTNLGGTIPTGEGIQGPLGRYLGVPFPRTYDVEQEKARTAKRKASAASSRERYLASVR